LEGFRRKARWPEQRSATVSSLTEHINATGILENAGLGLIFCKTAAPSIAGIDEIEKHQVWLVDCQHRETQTAVCGGDQFVPLASEHCGDQIGDVHPLARAGRQPLKIARRAAIGE